MSAKGSCLCKAVAYQVELPFERFYYCHCSRCRKATGAAHATNGFVLPSAFRWTKGEDNVQRFDLPEANASGCNSARPADRAYRTRHGTARGLSSRRVRWMRIRDHGHRR